ncbi:MAG: nucleotidyltransferase family protein, partial [Anaerolineales bacterium]|nr:nucleotidyltransferase family protein [Anaerolineales bacterium]
MRDDFPKTGPLNTTFGANWSAALDDWFRALLRQEPTKPPQVTSAEWRAWLDAVAAHGMTSLVFTWLLQTAVDHQPPAAIMAELRADHVANIALAERRRRQLTDLVTSFEQEGIHLLVLKGTALAHWLYAAPELRPSFDIDLLVKPEKCAHAAAILQRASYRFFMGEFRLHRHAEGFDAPYGKLSVDLHKALSSYVQVNKSFNLQSLFANSLKVGGIDSLNATDSLLMACMHLIYNHRQNIRLIWLYDVHLLAGRMQDLDQWQNVVQSSVRWQARYALSQALMLAQQLFGTQFPQVVDDFQRYPLTVAESRLHHLV